jgi:hypothetical protein
VETAMQLHLCAKQSTIEINLKMSHILFSIICKNKKPFSSVKKVLKGPFKSAVDLGADFSVYFAQAFVRKLN